MPFKIFGYDEGVFTISLVLAFISVHAQKHRPLQQYGDLPDSVQLNKVFGDQKKIMDCVPLQLIPEIKEAFSRQKHDKDFDLQAFVARKVARVAKVFKGRRFGHHTLQQRPAMGLSQRLGTLATDRVQSFQELRNGCIGRLHCPMLVENERQSVF